MPEGHLLHRLAEELSELTGQSVTAQSPQGRFPAAAVDGLRLTRTQAYGKNLLLDFSGDASVVVHLGMRGKWLRFAPVTGEAMKQVRLRLATDDVAWDLIAPSRCDLLSPTERSGLIARLGPDPLRADADPAEAKRRISAFPGPIGSALLDQTVIAGVGNVFRAEALHACRIAPTRPAQALAPDELGALWEVLVAMMSTAKDEGRIITVDTPDRLTRPEDQTRRVYKRDACYDCDTPVVVSEVGRRTAYTCPRCQPD